MLPPMAGWQTVEVGGFRVSARPQSRWRLWWPASHLPFVVGRPVTFEFQVAGSELPHIEALWWRLEGPFEQRGGEDVLAPQQRLGGDTFVGVFPVVTDMLPSSGEWQLSVAPSNGQHGPVVFVFDVVSLLGLIAKFVIPVVFGTAAIIIAVWNLVLNITRGSV